MRRNAAAFFGASLAMAASPLRAATEVDVALGDISVNKVPFLVAADAGIYAKYGLDVHQFNTPGAAAAMVWQPRMPLRRAARSHRRRVVLQPALKAAAHPG